MFRLHDRLRGVARKARPPTTPRARRARGAAASVLTQWRWALPAVGARAPHASPAANVQPDVEAHGRSPAGGARRRRRRRRAGRRSRPINRRRGEGPSAEGRAPGATTRRFASGPRTRRRKVVSARRPAAGRLWITWFSIVTRHPTAPRGRARGRRDRRGRSAQGSPRLHAASGSSAAVERLPRSRLASSARLARRGVAHATRRQASIVPPRAVARRAAPRAAHRDALAVGGSSSSPAARALSPPQARAQGC